METTDSIEPLSNTVSGKEGGTGEGVAATNKGFHSSVSGQKNLIEKEAVLSASVRSNLASVTAVEPAKPAVPQSRMSEAVPSKRDLRQVTFDLLSKVREPLPEEQKALEKKGWVFLQTEAKSLDQVVQEDRKYFGFISEDPELRGYVPPAMIVAIKPGEIAVMHSSHENQVKQLELLIREEQNLQLRENLSDDAKLLMLPASTLAQVDKAYFTITGQKFTPGFYMRALDEKDPYNMISVGRRQYNEPLFIGDKLRDGNSSTPIMAGRTLVFIQK